MNTESSVKRIHLIALLIFFLFPILIILLGNRVFSAPAVYPIQTLDTGWDINFQGTQIRNCDLSSINPPRLKAGNTVFFTRKLPAISDKTVVSPTLMFSASMLPFTVSLDGQEIYSYGMEHIKDGKLVPKKLHQIPLPEDYVGRTIKIRFTQMENRTGFTIPVFTLGNQEDLARLYLSDRRMILFSSMFLFVFGFMLLLMMPLLRMIRRDSGDQQRLFFNAILSCLMGSYLIISSNLTEYFTDRLSIVTVCEYVALYCIPPTVIGLIKASEAPRNKVLSAFLYLDLLAVVVLLVLHLTGILHIHIAIYEMELIYLAESLYILPFLLHHFRKQFKQNTDLNSSFTLPFDMFLAGLIFFLICGLFSMFYFVTHDFLFHQRGFDLSYTTLTVGALVFDLCLLLNYFYRAVEQINSNMTKQRMEGLAYKDHLTGLANRARSEQEMVRLSAAGNPMTVVSLDLDHLKFINDHYGHQDGDTLISDFASMLVKCFPGALLIGRMGGDEFIVILPGIDTQFCDTCLQDLEHYMAETNQIERRVRFAASYGYATSPELDDTPAATGKTLHDAMVHSKANRLYMLADDRMYVMKQRHHEEAAHV